MKILNIHGYRGNAENSAYTALKEIGCEVVSPQLDYDRVPTEEVMSALRDSLAGENAGVIAGTSLGGFFAAVLSAETGLPVMLVNPCLMPFYHLPKLGYMGDVRPFIALFGGLSDIDSSKVGCIIGGNDELIDTHSFAGTLFGSERFRVVPEGTHSGATLPLTEYFSETLKTF